VDVIHSFWAPNFHGKKDLVPGHPTTLWFRAQRPGTFRGQCAEFCGAQHAHMRFVIVAEPQEQFIAWRAGQSEAAAPPANEMQQRGQNIFLKTTCAMCHTIQGTGASATVGPNLTHVATRQMIAAGTLPNNRGHLGGWIIDPQHLKPGVRMPPHNLAPEDLQALLDYLESLK
jgi:cytochrome c oxidase subunit 2